MLPRSFPNSVMADLHHRNDGPVVLAVSRASSERAIVLRMSARSWGLDQILVRADTFRSTRRGTTSSLCEIWAAFACANA